MIWSVTSVLYFDWLLTSNAANTLKNSFYRKESRGMLSLAATSFFIGRLSLCFGQLVTTTTTTSATTTTTMITTLSTTTMAPSATVKVPTLNFINLFKFTQYTYNIHDPVLGTGFHVSSWKPPHPCQSLGDPSFPKSDRLALFPFNM